MSDVRQIGEDLAFVRETVGRRQRGQRFDQFSVYAAWAVYVLVGYTLIDVRPAWANAFFGIGWIPATIANVLVYRRREARGFERDAEMGRRVALHWGGGVALAIAGAAGLCSVIPALRGPASGQLIVVLVGLVYFLGGVHFDRRLMVLGPVMMAGGVLVGVVPIAYPWTALGVVIAAGLLVPSLFNRRADHVEA